MSEVKVSRSRVSREGLLRLLWEVIEAHPYLGVALHRAAAGEVTPDAGPGMDRGWASVSSYENQGNRWHG